MQGKTLYEYAVIRIVPRVEKEEFFNAGVILYSKDKKFIGTRINLPLKKLQCLSPETNYHEIEAHLQSFEAIAGGAADAGPIAALDAAGRFRWLTATRSTVVQSSKTHSGFCDDPEKALDDLFEKYVTG